MSQPEVSRRRVVQGVAVGGLSLPLLAACGSSSSSTSVAESSDDASSAPAGSSAATESAAPAADSLVAVADVPVGGGVILGDANVVVTQPTKGSFEGFSATCTHQGCILATVSDGTINCGCHGSQFSIKDGSNVTGPSGQAAGSTPALPKVAVKVQGSDVVQG